MSRLVPATLVFWLVSAVAIAVLFLPHATDFIGPDNDDAMRLVEVRDWLAGQGWFDMMQYRLGLEGGTLMHWSRLVDAPIGLLIQLFSTVMPVDAAERVTASLWPLLLSGPLLFALALGGRRLGGPQTMLIALGLGALFLFTSIRFRPGALDHHNVQLVLVMALVALLADREGRPFGHGLAGLAAALAIAVGAETTPLVAAACFCVVVRWIWQGFLFARAARTFGLVLALAVTAAFVATVPPRAYAAVTCDNLSFGFYALAALGGAGLFALAHLPARTGVLSRLGAATVLGCLLAVVARTVAPQCLGNPLAGLDPLLVTFWLDGVTEARSVLAMARTEPELVAGFYAVGLLAMGICILQIARGRARGPHGLFLVMLAVSWGVSLIQVRGALFANALSIPPFAFLVAEWQEKVRARPKDLLAAAAFCSVTLAAVPVVWGLGGVLWTQGVHSLRIDTLSTVQAEEPGECGNPADMATLAALAPGTVAAPSNSGADILRFTRHRVLSAPYHRNQGGMLTELYIGMAHPQEALAFLKGANVSILAFCGNDPQTRSLIAAKKDGLYSALAKGNVPAYLVPVANPNGRFLVFRIEAP